MSFYLIRWFKYIIFCDINLNYSQTAFPSSFAPAANAMYMAGQEMREVLQRDNVTIRENLEKVRKSRPVLLQHTRTWNATFMAFTHLQINMEMMNPSQHRLVTCFLHNCVL